MKRFVCRRAYCDEAGVEGVDDAEDDGAAELLWTAEDALDAAFAGLGATFRTGAGLDEALRPTLPVVVLDGIDSLNDDEAGAADEADLACDDAGAAED